MPVCEAGDHGITGADEICRNCESCQDCCDCTCEDCGKRLYGQEPSECECKPSLPTPSPEKPK